jgi:hypothetical protein
MNVQYAIKDGEIYLLEVNPRASRTVPFVAKVIGQPIAKIAARHHGRREARQLRPQSRRSSITSASRRRSSPSPASPASTSVLGPEMKLDRRGHRPRPLLRRRLRQEPARRRLEGPGQGHGLRLGPRRGQAAHPALDRGPGRARLPDRRDRRHAAPAPGERHPRQQDQQGAGRPPARRRRDQERRASSSSSTPPTVHRRWRTRARCAARPSCTRFPIIPPWPERSPRRRASRPIAAAISK